MYSPANSAPRDRESIAHGQGYDLALCPRCDMLAPLTASEGARMEAWGITLAQLLGRLESSTDDDLLECLALGDGDDLDELADWLLTEGKQRRRRESIPPLQLVRGGGGV